MGATYTRQSSYTDGDTITAAHTNDEFNQLLAFAAASTGHTHDGTAAEGGPITKLLGNSLTFGAGTSGTDITVTFDGESNDGVLYWMEDEDYFKFSDDIMIVDDEQLIFGTDSNIAISYDETTTDSLKIAATEGAGLAITLMADEGDDAGDEWKLNIADGGTLTLGNDIASAGSYVTHLTLTPNSTVASSTLAVAGNLTVGGTLTLGSGAELAEAELEMLDGITAGTVAASKAVVVDANKDAASFRNVTLTGELDAATLDISGNADIDGTTNLDAVDIDGVVQIDGVTTFGVDDTGVDVKFFGATSGSFMLWDESADSLLLTDSTPIKIGDAQDFTLYHDGSNSYITNSTGALKIATETSGIAVTIGHTTSETTIADNLSVTGDIDVDGTTNLDAVDIDGAVQIDSTITVGANDQGYDIIFYGDTASANITWDTSADDLIFNGAAGLIIPDGQLTLGSTAVSSTAAELNLLDGVTAGTVTASKAVVVDSNKDIGTFRNVTIDGTFSDGNYTFDTSGNVTGLGTVASGNITSSGTVQGTVITATTGFAPDASDGAYLGTSSLQFSDLFLADGAVVNLGDDQDVTLTHYADNGILLNSTRKLYFEDGSNYDQYIGSAGSGVTAIAAPTEIDLTATTIDINGAVDISGNATVGGNLTVSGTTTTVDSTTVAIADSMLKLAKDQGTSADAVDFGFYGKYGVGGTAKYAGVFRDLSATGDPFTFFDSLEDEPGGTVDTSGTGYDLADISAGGATFADSVTITGDLTVSGDDITMGTNTSGYIMVADGTNFNPVAVSGDVTMANTGAVTIASGAVETAMIAADAITGAKIADDAIDSEHYTDGSIDTAHIAADAVTGAKIADDAIDSEHYTDGSIDTAHIANSQITTAKIATDAVTGAKIADDAIDSEHYTDGSIDTAHIADNQVTLAKMAGIARGKIIYGDASGDPAVLTIGSSGEYLKSDGNDLVWGSATVSGLAADDLTVGDAAITIGNGSTSADITIDSGADIVLDAAGGNVEFKDAGTLQLSLDMDGTAGAQVVQLGVDGDDLVFKQYDGTTVLTLEDGTTVAVATDLTVGDDLSLASDSAELKFGQHGDITLTHVHNQGLTLTNELSSSDDIPIIFQLKSEENSIVQDDTIASIEFAAGDVSGTDAATVAAGIHAIAEGSFTASANATKLVFTTGVSETAAYTATAKMTLSSAGLLTIADDFMLKDGGTIGVASTNDALTISSAGLLTVKDDLVIKSGGTIGGANDTDLLTLGNGALTVAGTLDATAITASGKLITDDTTDATTTADGSLQTDGGLSVVKDAILGNDVKLLSDSAVLSLGAGSDATFTHDGTTGLTIAATPISIDSTGELHLNSTTGDIKLQDGGTDQITFDLDGTSGEVIMKPAVDSDDLVISQYDGTEVIRIEDNASLGLVGNKLSIANSSSDVVIKPLTDAKDIIFQQYDGTAVMTVEDNVSLAINNDVTVTGRASGTVTTDNDGNFDLQVSNQWKCTPSGDFDLTFSNPAVGQSGSVMMINSGGHTISAHASVAINATTLTTISSAGTYMLSYYCSAASGNNTILVSASGVLT